MSETQPTNATSMQNRAADDKTPVKPEDFFLCSLKDLSELIEGAMPRDDERKLYLAIKIDGLTWVQPGRTLGVMDEETDRAYVASLLNRQMSWVPPAAPEVKRGK